MGQVHFPLLTDAIKRVRFSSIALRTADDATQESTSPRNNGFTGFLPLSSFVIPVLLVYLTFHNLPCLLRSNHLFRYYYGCATLLPEPWLISKSQSLHPH